MGLQKSSGNGNLTFVNLSGKRGAFEIKGKNDKGETIVKESYDRLEGNVTKIEIAPSNLPEQENTFELKVRTDDGSGAPVQFSMTLGTFLSAKMAGLLNAADVSKPMTFMVGRVEKGQKLGDTVADKEFPWVAIRQDGEKLSPVYLNGATELPAPKEVKLNGKVHKDMSEIDAITAEVLAGVKARVEALHAPSEQDAAGDEGGIDPAEAARAAGQRPRG